MNIYVGTSGFSYSEWKGSFYPKDLPDRQKLRYYGEHFGTVEINATFKRMPTAAGLNAWAKEVSTEFLFAIKAPERITHRQKLLDVDDLVSQLLEVTAVLKERQGPLLFQLPPTLKKDVARLRTFLELLPSQSRVTLEFRHPSWFEDEIFGLLRDHRVALCIADAENELQIPFMATTDWGYLRLRQPSYSDKELKVWIKRIQEQDWRDVFVFFKHDDKGNGPILAKRFMELVS